jgi:SAM-dependent methyltransferase
MTEKNLLSGKQTFRPITHNPPDSFLNILKFILRYFLDFQFNTIFAHLRHRMKHFEGKILDVGCGNSPFKHLLNSKKAEYFGIDIKDSENFDYDNTNIIHYDGKIIPFENEKFDTFICTEVLEHVEDPTLLISEIHRILKQDGQGIFTIPWSARFHYQPYDYHRYTPTMLQILFKGFRKVSIIPRGTDVSVIISKIIVVYFGFISNIFKPNFISILLIPIKIIVSLLTIPVITFCILIGHLALIFNIGSDEDPLGYTIILKK